jgi:hypothetical protein
LIPATLTGYLWLKGWQPHVPGLSCPLRALTGIPCPTCFLTRSTAAALRGELGESLALHAFGPALAAGLILWSVDALRRRQLYPRGLKAWHLVVFSAALLIYWGVRLALHVSLGLEAFPSG